MANDPVNGIDPHGESPLSEGLDAALNYGISAAIQANQDRDTAEQAARDYSNTIPAGEDSLYDGAGDAYRHCVWSCLMRRSIGRAAAEGIAGNHEAKGDNSEMDNKNNEMGCSLGDSEHGSCENLCSTSMPRLLTNKDWLGRWRTGGPQPLGSPK